MGDEHRDKRGKGGVEPERERGDFRYSISEKEGGSSVAIKETGIWRDLLSREQKEDSRNCESEEVGIEISIVRGGSTHVREKGFVEASRWMDRNNQQKERD